MAEHDLAALGQSVKGHFPQGGHYDSNHRLGGSIKDALITRR